MPLLSRENTKLIVVAAFCVLIGSLVPATASAARRAIVPNADRVDGKHAVESGASVRARKGKLVATNQRTGRLPNNIIGEAPDAKRLGGRLPKYVTRQWLTVSSTGTIIGRSPGAASLTVSHPDVGTYCVSRGRTISHSISGTVQSRVNGFENLTMIVAATVNTSACPNELRVYTTKDDALSDQAFTLTFALAPPPG